MRYQICFYIIFTIFITLCTLQYFLDLFFILQQKQQFIQAFKKSFQMLHKRKLIKKARANRKNNTSLQETEIESHQSLIQRLKSSNPSQKQEAITILANIHILVPQFSQPQFIKELINVLYTTNNTIVYQTIFALSNLCEIQPQLTHKLFEAGLDKALIQLSSTDKQLLKPILIFFITIADSLPAKYHYLLKGVQNSLNANHLKQNSALCLQFLFRTHNLPQLNLTLSETILQQIALIFTSSDIASQKSYAVAILAQSLDNQGKWNGQIQQILFNYMTETLVCVDLEKEYKMNFQVGQIQKVKQSLDQQLDEGKQDQMAEEKGSQNNRNVNKVEQNKKRQQKLKFFITTVQGTQILLQFLLNVIESNSVSSDDDSEQQDVEQVDEQQMGQQKQTQNEKNEKSIKKQAKNSSLRAFVLNFIQQNMSMFPKFLSLSSAVVPSTQNILYLFYHLLMQVDKQLGLSTSNNQQNQKQINQLIQSSLQNLFQSIQQSGKDQEHDISLEQYEILMQCLQIGLKVLLKNKGLGVSEDFLINFSKSYMTEASIFKSINLLQQIKPSWLVMLQLYSKILNPQKNKNISVQQNFQIGQILKHLIISIPYQELQQLRCQVIDTLFDVYSNEMFDKSFVELGFLIILQSIIKQSHNISKQSGNKKGKNNKQQKFINDVLKDIKRFLQYKQKMIQF